MAAAIRPSRPISVTIAPPTPPASQPPITPPTFAPSPIHIKTTAPVTLPKPSTTTMDAVVMRPFTNGQTNYNDYPIEVITVVMSMPCPRG